MDFFEQFDQARWEFTYGAPDNEALNALQVGLVAYFYIDQGYLPEKRQAMADAFALYDQAFGDKLKWGYYNDPKHPKLYHQFSLKQKQEKITEEGSDAMYFFWSSERGLTYASNYRIRLGSPAAWFEYIHHDISCMSFYLPIEELEKGEGYIGKLLHDFCNILNPLHGLMGLGVQNCRDEEKYQHLEYEIGQEFLGVDIAGPGREDKHLRNGIRSINWYTFINDEWLAKLGGITTLREQLPDPRIALLPYDGGLIVRAGDWPELGWVKQNPYPELYVAVNRAFKPIRAPEIAGMAYGSICGEIRYNDISTAQWLARFDAAPVSTQSPRATTQDDGGEEQRIDAWSGEHCPHTGQWGCLVAGSLHYKDFQKGQTLPDWPEHQPQRVLWTLLEREDGGSCFVSASVE